MNGLDYVLLGIIAIAALRCWFRGIIGEFLSVAAVLGGLLSGILFYRPVGAWLSTLKALGGFEPVAGFVASFALVFIAIKLVERALVSLLENLNLNILDRVLGLGFGALEGIIVSAIVVMLLRYQPIFDVEALLSGSLVARLLMPVVAQGLSDLSVGDLSVGEAGKVIEPRP